MLMKLKMFVLNKWVLGHVTTVWEKLTGYRTQICFVLFVCTCVGYFMGYIEKDQAWTLCEGFAVAGGFAFFQKLKRWRAEIDGFLGSVRPPRNA